jgi:hypothetical protein
MQPLSQKELVEFVDLFLYGIKFKQPRNDKMTYCEEYSGHDRCDY